MKFTPMRKFICFLIAAFAVTTSISLQAYAANEPIYVNSSENTISNEAQDIYIIGGGELYKQTIGLATRIHLTLVDDIPTEADAFFPTLNPDEWIETIREDHPTDEKHAQTYTFIDYKRK